MERKEAMLKTGCLRMLIVFMAVFLFAAPSVQASETVPAGQEWDIDYDVLGILNVYGTANVYAGFYAVNGIYAFANSKVNIHGGAIGPGQGIIVSNYNPDPNVTVYGTDFADSSGPITTTQWTPGLSGDTLTVQFTDEYGVPIGDPCALLFYSADPINLVDTGVGPGPGPITVQIDIKPGSDPNPINPGSNGVIPVAILTTDSFDASTVDPGSVTLAGAEVAVRGKSEKTMARLEDIDGDGDDDLLLQIDTQSDGAVWETGPVSLEGTTYDGQTIEGTDDVVIVPPE